MALRLTEEEYSALMNRRGAAAEIQPKRRNKFGNRRVEIDGMKFDSQHEANFYFGTLVPRMKAGELKVICRQVKFDLPGASPTWRTL